MTISAETLKSEILHLKKERQATILAHFYEDSDIQDIADSIGDSLFLAQQGEKLTSPVALMAGVVFMAETVKILSPTKTVIVPDLNAGCSLVDHSPFNKYLEWRQKYPNGIAVTYVNSSAEVKSITDITCTSSNAEKIVASLPNNRPILFGPDRNLGRYIAKKLNKKIGSEMILWPGACQVHVLFSARKLFELKKDHPEAIVLAHPECDEVILDQADVIGSTSRILEETQKNKATTFIVATEDGIFHQMKKSRPDATFIQAPAEGSCACNQCPYMKMNTLLKVKNALLTLKPEVTLKNDIIEKARIPIKRMLDLTAGQKIEWPKSFQY